MKRNTPHPFKFFGVGLALLGVIIGAFASDDLAYAAITLGFAAFIVGDMFE